jgi:hypothetical protein
MMFPGLKLKLSAAGAAAVVEVEVIHLAAGLVTEHLLREKFFKQML